MPAGISRLIDGHRLWQRLMDLARFGATSKGGVCRQALSGEEIAARATLVDWARSIGLVPSTDAAANLFLALEGREPGLPPLLIGSHLDSQPTGGKFDGAYGVLAALEAVQAISGHSERPRRTIEVVAWTNEEGSRFAPGMMGSAVFTGKRKLADILPVKDRGGVTVETALKAVLDADAGIARRPLGFPVAGFLEAHIEQGRALQDRGCTAGVVSGIQGKRTFRVDVIGEESHAGTTPRRARRDALTSAVAVVDALQKAMWDEADTVRFTIGMFEVTPNAPSVVPGRVHFSIDLRHDEAEVIGRLGDAIAGICETARGKCSVAVRELLYDAPLQFPEEMRARIAGSAERLGISHMHLQSPAGHDARYLHYVCPTGMIFIPCKDGISHNEAESITPDDAAAGARILAEVAFELANQ
ncbi:MAG TPA: M20 family metallo-hydrolase [Hyphomicrobiaceae bacterium]|nr:M20 family metallo-hydrolase [Hyphomicrobiaceae bacterium]